MQEKDFGWFVENLDELYKRYGSVYVAIKNKTVLGTYPSYADGVRETLKTERPGTFIIQQCGPDKSAYTNYISSFNFIAN